MYSLLKPDFLYTDVTPDICESDINVVSDLWNMNGRNVYRGSRDSRYTHANVYWLYSEDLERVGCSEHSLSDHADFRLLWFLDNEFGTLLQEEGWNETGDVWTLLPRHVFERCINEGWTTPQQLLYISLHGDTRFVTPSMLQKLPTVYTCEKCKSCSFQSGHGTPSILTIPDSEKVIFVDNDLIVYNPPANSIVWSKLGLLHDDDSLPEQEEEQPQEEKPLETQVQAHVHMPQQKLQLQDS
jgi:hypothetical protein